MTDTKYPGGTSSCESRASQARIATQQQHRRPISRAQSPPKIRHRAQKFDLILLGRNATYFGRSATNILVNTEWFCVLRHHRDQPNSGCRNGVAMVSQCDQGHCFRCCNGVALRPMLQIVPTTCPTHANFEFLAQI